MRHRTAGSLILVLMTVALLSVALVTATQVTLWAAPAHSPNHNPATVPLAQSTPTADEAGQEYIVQPGDSLYKISGQFYDEPSAYQRIVDATNAKAAVDSRFTRIVNPRFIQTGQRLWIPDSANLPIVDASASATTSAADEPAPTVTESATDPATAAVGVRFVDPLDGAVVAPTFVVTMAANGLTVEPAGAINPDAGHFHILVDTDFVPVGEVIITDEQHLHFGQGQMTTTLTLEPGEHVLRLQFANGAHIALDGDQYRDTITVTVDADAAQVMPRNHAAATIDVHFVTPTDGATVSGRFDVVMAADGLIVEPAGAINPDAGHFHILVDTDFVPAGDIIITDEQHLHYGQGQAVTKLDLSPGEHVLRLQFANGAHIALAGEQYRDEITVTVTE